MVKIIGEKVKPIEDDKVVLKRGKDIYVFPRKIEAFKTNSKIIPDDYALIQKRTKAVYAISMAQGYNDEGNQEDTIIRVLKAGLKVPRASRFIRQLLNVEQAFQVKRFLYDAAGNLIEKETLRDYARTLESDHKVWSPEFFIKGKGYLGLDVVTISGLDDKGKPVYKKEPLEECLKENCYANLGSANSQGFLTQKAKTQEYKPGKTITFHYPRKNAAVRFCGHSVGAVFSCDWDPKFTFNNIGVFTCVEEARTESQSAKNK